MSTKFGVSTFDTIREKIIETVSKCQGRAPFLISMELDSYPCFSKGSQGEEMSTKCHQCVSRLCGSMRAVWRLSFRTDVFSSISMLTVIKIMASPIWKMLFKCMLLSAVKMLGVKGFGEPVREGQSCVNSTETAVVLLA